MNSSSKLHRAVGSSLLESFAAAVLELLYTDGMLEEMSVSQ